MATLRFTAELARLVTGGDALQVMHKARVHVKTYMRQGKVVVAHDQQRKDGKPQAPTSPRAPSTPEMPQPTKRRMHPKTAPRKGQIPEANVKRRAHPTPSAGGKSDAEKVNDAKVHQQFGVGDGKVTTDNAQAHRKAQRALMTPSQGEAFDANEKKVGEQLPELEQKGGMFDLPMPDVGDTKAFNALPKYERAKRTAHWSDVKKELDQRFPPRGYSSGSVVSALNDARHDVDRLTDQGVFAEGNRDKAHQIVEALGEALHGAGVNGKDAAYILEDSVRKLAHQEHEAIRRTLGDHGVRHLSHNVEAIGGIFDALEGGGSTVDPKDRLAGIVVMINHDIGYTIPAIARGGFKIKDNYHPEAGAEVWRQQSGEEPIWSRVLDHKRTGQMFGWIRNHSGTRVDWKGDPVGSAIRMADNTHLFADKMPEVLFNSPGAMEAMVKISLIMHQGNLDNMGQQREALGEAAGPVQYGKYKNGFDALKSAMKGHLKDTPEPQRSAMEKAIGEVGSMTPEFLASRLAGRDPSWSYDGASDTMKAEVEQSPLRSTIGRIFGEDKADQQFVKLLKDYGVTDHDPSKPVTLGKDGGSKLELSWVPPRSKPSSMEQQYKATSRRVMREWKAVHAIPEGPKRDKALEAFSGKLAKADDEEEVGPVTAAIPSVQRALDSVATLRALHESRWGTR